MKIKAILLPFAALCLAAMTSACAANDSTAAEETTTTGTDAGTETVENTAQEYPIVIEHAFGTTTIEAKPERIATIAWGNQDTPLALDVIPVGVSAANYGKVTDNILHTWTEAAFLELGEENPVVFNDLTGFNYEEISDTQPDIILAAYSGMSQEEYELLSQIAPVVPYESQPYQTTWREQTILNATAMGMKSEGEAKVAETDALILEKLGNYPDLAGTKTAFAWVSADDFSVFYIYLPTDPRAAYLLDLGLEFPDSVISMAENADDFSVTISRENADQLADVEMLIMYGDANLLEALQADELMSQIPAIADGAVVMLDSTSDLAAATTPSILSIPANIDEYLELLAEAHSKIK